MLNSGATLQFAIWINYLSYPKNVRIMNYSNYDTPLRNIFIEFNILPLNHLIQNRISFMMYKHVNGLLPEVMNKLYVTNNQIHHHFTRQHHLFHTSNGRTNIYATCFSNICPRIWNVLQTKINVKVSISKFKNITKIFSGKIN